MLTSVYSKLTTASRTKNLPTHSWTSDARASASERSACLTATFRNGSTRRFPVAGSDWAVFGDAAGSDWAASDDAMARRMASSLNARRAWRSLTSSRTCARRTTLCPSRRSAAQTGRAKSQSSSHRTRTTPFVGLESPSSFSAFTNLANSAGLANSGDGDACATKKSLTGSCGRSGSTLYGAKSVIPHDRSTSRSEKARPERKFAGDTTIRNAASATIAGVRLALTSLSPPMKLVAAVATACLGHSVLNATPASLQRASSAMDSRLIPTFDAV